MTAPDEDLKRGRRFHQDKNFTAAEKIYRQVLEHEPNHADGWLYLGIVYADQERYDEAITAYKRAIQIKPDSPVAFNNLGNVYKSLHNLSKALACYDNALQLKPDYLGALRNKAAAFFWEGYFEESLSCYHQVLHKDQQDAEAHTRIGIIQLLNGHFNEGWQEYNWRWKTDGKTFPSGNGQVWDGLSLENKTLVVIAEQGLGDTLHFIRYAELLKQTYDCRIIAAVQPALLKILKSCNSIDRLISNEIELPQHDVFIPLLDIPGILNHGIPDFPADVPYLSADNNLAKKWQEELANFTGFKVGIAWQGSPNHNADSIRSIPLKQMAPLGQLKGIHLFSLQKQNGIDQLDNLAGCLDIVEFGDGLDTGAGSFMDTAAILSNLDLLITADTAVAHLAGALAVPTWVALPYAPDWRWMMERGDSPWYPTMRLFRQTKTGDWHGIFLKMAEQLQLQSTTISYKKPEDYHLAACGMNRLARTKFGLMLYNRHDIYIGRSLDMYGEYSAGECDLFKQLIRNGNVVVEVGAHIGTHTLLLADIVEEKGSIYAFEPQRVLFQTLCANMVLNGKTNVHCRCEAVGEKIGEVMVPSLDYTKPNNFGGLGLGDYQHGEKTPVITIDSLKLTHCHFLKIDVEGKELDVLKGAEETITKCKPLLYVENECADKAASAALIQYILSFGYELYWHLPPLFKPGNYFNNEKNEFGSIGSINMLGIHSSFASSIEGLRPIKNPNSDWRD